MSQKLCVALLPSSLHPFVRYLLHLCGVFIFFFSSSLWCLHLCRCCLCGYRPSISFGSMTHKHYETLIIGSGFGGLCAAIKLREKKMYDFAILEKGDEIGGTWRDNIYPGIACDLPSITYSFSFEQNPNWSRVFAPGDEIQKYALHCVEKYELRQHLLLSTNLTKAVFDDSTHLWMMYTAASPFTPSYSCRYLISATGILTQPKLPDIPGLKDFK